MMVIVNLLAVEVTVTVTSSAFQRVECTFFSDSQNSRQPSIVWPPIPTAWFFKHFLYLVIVDEVVGILYIWSS